MIVFVTLPQGAGHIHGFICKFGRQCSRLLAEITYHDLLERGWGPGGVYIFCDRERMSEEQLEIARSLAARLEVQPGCQRILNDPRRQLDRIELLGKLHQEGLNPYRAWRWKELPDEIPLPVFVRVADDHLGPRSNLLYTRAEIDLQCRRLLLGRTPEEQILVVQYLDTRGGETLFRKYGAFRIGDQIIAQHMFLSPEWNAKWESRIRTEETIALSDDYYRENPHQHLLMPFFEAAGIEYGRIDYAMLGGEVVAWEINDNPMYQSRNPQGASRIFKGPRFMHAFECLLDPHAPQSRVEVEL